jgi:hypothetical protein
LVRQPAHVPTNPSTVTTNPGNATPFQRPMSASIHACAFAALAK